MARRPVAAALDGLGQPWPDWLERLPGEDLAAWHERMTLELVRPLKVSPLKLSYLEVLNPLQCRSIVDAGRHEESSSDIGKPAASRTLTSEEP